MSVIGEIEGSESEGKNNKTQRRVEEGIKTQRSYFISVCFTKLEHVLAKFYNYNMSVFYFFDGMKLIWNQCYAS